MLSIENPPSSSDPSCSSPTSTHDSPSHLDLPLTHHLPKFSIRDYVFTSRSKDIKKNWPFSLKNLQLCLRHGVKDVLPPFQSLASVKTQSLKPCTVVDESNSLAEKNNIISSSGPNNNNNNSSNNIDITSSCRSAAENDLPSATTSVVSHSEIDSLPIPNNPPFEPSLHPTKKLVPQPKKCRLIVKFGGNSDRASAEDIASNSTAVSETMASKVCPVCKTFSSSSNTTLNAHIDQCLSAESPPKWSADSKLTKHRIKPRKSRLMEDIYATARRCTLEELDKRNGTNWATVSTFSPPTEKLEVPAEVKKQRVVSRLHPEDAGEVGEVYIDASGTKVRILSKSSDATVPSVEELPAINDDKDGKLMSIKKKKRHGKKHLKFLKLAPQSRKLFSLKTRAATQVFRPGQGDYGVEENGKKVKQISCDNSGTLRQWVCSKRTGVAKKVNSNQEGPQPFRCNWHFARDLLVEKQQTGETTADRNRVQKYANLSENLISSPEAVESVGKPVYQVQVSDKWERSSGRKRVGSPLLGARLSDASERSLPPIKHASLTFEPSNTTSNNNKTSTHGGLVTNSETPPRAGTKPSIGRHACSTKALRTLSRKNGSSISTQSSMVQSRSDDNGQCSVQKNTHCYPSGEGEEEAWHSEVEHHYSVMCDSAENLAGDVADKTSLESSRTTPQSFSNDGQEDSDPLTRASDGVVGNTDAMESVEGNVTSSSKSVDTNGLKLSNHSSNPSNSLQSIEDYNGMLFGGKTLTAHTDTAFVDGETIYSDGEGNVMIQRNPNMESEGPELDSGVGDGNLFPEVDPIPIPGPPGSFLPSPRDMGSDDFQGNSSLTSSRVHSSQDHLDIVDGDLSDSLISASSTISNSTQNRSNLKCSEPLTSVGTHAVQDKMTSSFCTASVNVENAVLVPQTGAGAERVYFDDERFKLSKISIERRPLGFKNDGQPCCCQRKERTNDNAPNYQESQLLKRRTMAAVAAPVIGKQIGCSSTGRLNNLEVRPEVLSLNNSTSVGSEKLVLPFAQPQASSVLSKGSPEAGMKHSARGDSESASPSPSNPVLRLMGKNLMVVNKEDDSPSSVPVPGGRSPPNSAATSQFPMSSGANSTKMKSSFPQMAPQMASQRPMNYGHNPYNGMGQSYDVRIPNGFKNYSNPRTPQTPAQISEGLISNQMIHGGFTVSMQPPTYESAYGVPSRYSRTMIRSNEMSSSSAYNVEKDTQKNADGGSSFKEIIVIDDSPENEANVTKYSEGLRGNYPTTSSGISFPSVSGYNSRNTNPFSRYHAQDPSLSSQSTAAMLHESNSYTIPPRLPNASPVKWSCSPEGSGMLQRNSYVAASNSSGHLRSTLYYSPSLS